MSIGDYYNYFGVKPVSGKLLKNEELHNLYRIPKKDKGKDMPRFQTFKSGLIQQADLLHLPNDKGFEYALVVVDNASKKVDAQPLKDAKAITVRNAFKSIYSRSVLDLPKLRIEVDGGPEFKGETKKYFQDNGIGMRVAKPYRHRQQALVERKNLSIGSALLKRQTAQEILTGVPDRQWTADLPKIVKQMNENVKDKKIPDPPSKVIVTPGSKNILQRGTKVRVALEVPRDVTEGKILHGKFRSSDIRWDMKIRTIREVLIKPGFPPMYLVDGDKGPNKDFEPVAYTRNQLQIVSADEKPPSMDVIRGKPDLWAIQTIVRKLDNGKYLVKWKAGDGTQETRERLEEDVPDMLKEFDREHNPKPPVITRTLKTKKVIAKPVIEPVRRSERIRNKK